VRYLLDTHALLWFVSGDPAMSERARAIVSSEKHTILASAASAWEIATKHRLGKLPEAQLLATNFADAVTGLGFDVLAISAEAAQVAGGWRVAHRDPFDRILAAQSRLESAPLITNDPALGVFKLETVW
jgi:PIN domain nuclease of toxin-antitoxin system